MHFIIVILIGILVTSVGAIPFGLVNLNVMDISFRVGRREAMQLALGAAIIEVVYGIIAIVLGTFLHRFIDSNSYLKVIIVLIIGIVGVIYFLKKIPAEETHTARFRYFIYGAFLNIISFQVFLFWIVAAAYLHTHEWFIPEGMILLLFALGIWIGKMIVLWIYAISGKTILSRFKLVARNINRIIGTLLIFIMILQFLKMLV